MSRADRRRHGHPATPPRAPGGGVRPRRRGDPPAPRPEAGQAAVETALVLPLVAVVLLALVQVALVARDQVVVVHAAREGARAAAADPDPTAARRASLAAGSLDPARTTVTTSGRRGPGSRVRVEVSYRAPTDVPLVGALVDDLLVVATTTMRVER